MKEYSLIFAIQEIPPCIQMYIVTSLSEIETVHTTQI